MKYLLAMYVRAHKCHLLVEISFKCSWPVSTSGVFYDANFLFCGFAPFFYFPPRSVRCSLHNCTIPRAIWDPCVWQWTDWPDYSFVQSLRRQSFVCAKIEHSAEKRWQLAVIEIYQLNLSSLPSTQRRQSWPLTEKSTRQFSWCKGHIPVFALNSLSVRFLR